MDAETFILAASLISENTEGDPVACKTAMERLLREDDDKTTPEAKVPSSPFRVKSLIGYHFKGGFTGTRKDKIGRNMCYRDGRRVPCNPSVGPSPVKKPKASTEKPAKRPVKEKPSVEQVKGGIDKFIAEGKVTPESAKLVVDQIMSLTVVQINDLKKQLGATAKGNKAELAKQLVDQILAKISPNKEPKEEKLKEPLEVYLKQDRPNNPVAKAIRNNKSAVDKVKMISSIWEGVLGGRYDEIVKAKKDEGAAWSEVVKTKDQHGPESKEYRKVIEEWMRLEKLTRNYDKAKEEAEIEIREKLKDVLKSKNPPKISKSYMDGIPEKKWDDDLDEWVPTGKWLLPPFSPDSAQERVIDQGIGFVESVTEWKDTNQNVEYRLISPRASFSVIDKKRKDVSNPLRFRRLLGHKTEVITGKPTINVGVFGNERTGTATQVHELGHMIETLKPGVVEKVNAFINYRFGDESLVDMATVPGGESMKGEMVRKDQFDRAFDAVSAHYIGKEYKDKDTGESFGTEVTSMGIQALYEDPVGFCQKDPEYAAFIIGVLHDE